MSAANKGSQARSLLGAPATRLRGHQPHRQVHARFFRQSLPSDLDAHAALTGIAVARVSDSSAVKLPELWTKDDICMLIFARSFGCPFCQCAFCSLLHRVAHLCVHAGAGCFAVHIFQYEACGMLQIAIARVSAVGEAAWPQARCQAGDACNHAVRKCSW